MNIFFNFIPSKPKIYHGQNQRLDQFQEFFTVHNVIAITGLPGIGKSSLLKAFLNETPASYKTVWFACEQNSHELNLVMIQENILKLSDREIVPSSENDVVIQLLQIIEETQMLVVFDGLNIEDIDPLHEFLHLASQFLKNSKIIITKQTRLFRQSNVLSEVCEISPIKLDDHQMASILDSSLQMHGLDCINPSEVDQVVRICYGNPLLAKTFISLIVNEAYAVSQLLQTNSEFYRFVRDLFEAQLISHLSDRDKRLLLLFQLFEKPLNRTL
ncbi:ATP-binding protein, partial [bacterium]|nr:ATP-binding protein [bacterium]